MYKLKIRIIERNRRNPHVPYHQYYPTIGWDDAADSGHAGRTGFTCCPACMPCPCWVVSIVPVLLIDLLMLAVTIGHYVPVTLMAGHAMQRRPYPCHLHNPHFPNYAWAPLCQRSHTYCYHQHRLPE